MIKGRFRIPGVSHPAATPITPAPSNNNTHRETPTPERINDDYASGQAARDSLTADAKQQYGT